MDRVVGAVVCGEAAQSRAPFTIIGANYREQVATIVSRLTHSRGGGDGDWPGSVRSGQETRKVSRLPRREDGTAANTIEIRQLTDVLQCKLHEHF